VIGLGCQAFFHFKEWRTPANLHTASGGGVSDEWCK